MTIKPVRMTAEAVRLVGMGMILASGEKTESHDMSDLTESGVIDLGHVDLRLRQEMLFNYPVLKPYLDEP